jgi:hypothetical protein
MAEERVTIFILRNVCDKFIPLTEEFLAVCWLAQWKT